jgi:Flp pilus assembly protein TadG
LELVVLAPAVLALLTGVVIAGRFEAASAAVEQASAAAAREASLARTPVEGQDAARRAALARQDLNCTGLDVAVRFTPPATDGPRGGSPGSVTVTLSCMLDLSRLTVPGMPGSRRITASTTSVLDAYRSAP